MLRGSSIFRFSRRFRRCEDGAAATEFAFALPVLVLLLFGMIEMAMLLFSQVLAEGGLRQAARFGITGQDPAGATRQEQIVNVVMQHSHGLLDIGPSDVEVLVYPDFASIGQPEPLTYDANGNGSYDTGDLYDDINGNMAWDEDMGAPGPGASGDIVLYRIDYEWDWMTPVFQVFGGPAGSVDMQASIAVRNEPYTVE